MLIPIFIVFVGLAGLLIVIGRKLSVASGETYELSVRDGDVAGSEASMTESNFHVLPLPTFVNKVRFSLSGVEVGNKTKRLGEKFIRRAHIGLLKLDNWLLRWLELCSTKSLLRESLSLKSKKRFYFKNLLAVSKNLKNPNDSKRGNISQKSKALGSDDVLKSAKDKNKTHFFPKSQLAASSYEEFWLGILRQNPKNPHPYKRLGEIYMQQGLYEEAEAVFAYALKHNAKDLELTSWIKNIKVKREQK